MELGELDEMIYIAHFALCIVHNKNSDKGRGRKPLFSNAFDIFLKSRKSKFIPLDCY